MGDDFLSRRSMLRLLGLSATAAAIPAWAREATPPAALLLPLTGPHAALARSLAHAAALALGNDHAALPAFDTAGSEGTAGAARAAIRHGAPLLIGPLFTPQVAAAVADAGQVPVITLTNDANAAQGAFVLGITPTQPVAAILGYARSRGVRRVALAAGTSGWDAAAAAAASTAARDLGLTLVDDRPDTLPDAVLVTGGGDALTAAARATQGSGVQLLASHQALALTGAGLEAVAGAWLAGPDPDGFADFARRFESAFGNPPGLIAGLAYDAAGIARSLAASGHGRDGLTGSAGFPGVTGAVRFRADGSASRELAILVADSSGFRTVARATG